MLTFFSLPNVIISTSALWGINCTSDYFGVLWVMYPDILVLGICDDSVNPEACTIGKGKPENLFTKCFCVFLSLPEIQ